MLIKIEKILAITDNITLTKLCVAIPIWTSVEVNASAFLTYCPCAFFCLNEIITYQVYIYI